MSMRALAIVALLLNSSRVVAEVVDSALAADDACLAGEECSLELRQLRGEMKDAEQQAIETIAKQMEENKKYETTADDESGITCHPEKGTAITCGAGTKCCTSKRSYLAGQAHAKQTKLALYSICCPMDSHCKYDTIFVSCAPGAGPDDYSGVLAGVQEQEEEEEADVIVDEAAQEDQEQTAEDEEEAVADEEEEEEEEDEDDEELAGGKCLGGHDMKIWKDGGKRNFDAALNHCGRACVAGFPCTKDCMSKRGYSAPCAACMADLVGCSRDHCLNQCISNDKSTACTHCVRSKCRPGMRHCSGLNAGGK